MANLNNITPMKGLPPFLQYFRTIGIIPASYKVTMTYEEQVLELMRFIRDEIIPKINENVLATKELQEKFKELVTYVNEYFENIDFQEKINIKLDKMAESGELAEIINQEIFGEIQKNINELNTNYNSMNNNLNSTMSQVTTNKEDIDDIKENKASNTELLNFESIVNSQLASQFELLSRLQGGTPIVVSSTSEMTDTSKIYVLTTDGKWYYYNGTQFVVGGDYQANVDTPTTTEILGFEKQLGIKLFGLGNYSSSDRDFISVNPSAVNVRFAICMYADGRKNFSLGFTNSDNNLFNIRVRNSGGGVVFTKNNCNAIEWTATADEKIYIEIWKGDDAWGTIYTDEFLNKFRYKYFNSICDSMIPCTATPTVFNTSGEEIESQDGNWACFRLSVPDNSIIHVFGYGASAYPTIAKMNNGVLDSIIFNVSSFGEAIDKAFYFEKACDLIVQLYNYTSGQRVDTPTVKINIPYTGFEGKVLSVIGDSYVANNGQPTDYTWHYKIAQVLKMQYNNYGINGDGLVGTRAGLTPVKDRLSSIYAKSNYILVVGGENDANINENINTFKAGIEDIIKTLYNDFRNAKIGFVIPWGDSYSNRTFIKPYADAIKEICNKYGVAVFDSWNNYMPSYNEKQRTLYYQSGTDSSHLNFTGHQAFLPRILEWFKSI